MTTKLIWVNFFHIYQPPNWPKKIIIKAMRESYRPIVNTLLKNKQLRITLNISGSLTQQLIEHQQFDIIKKIKKLATRHQVELVGTALYHPLLPLLPDQEIIRQIKLNDIVNKKHFGAAYQPKGFFPPEMAYSNKVARLVKNLGFKWIIIDEISAYGRLGKLNFDQKYTIKNTQLAVIFRNRNLSDYISFRSQINKPDDFWQETAKDNRSQTVLITAMDGENLGHHRKGLDKLWKKLITEKNIRSVTISELLEKYKHFKDINPRKASWSSRESELKHNNPYVLWLDPKNPIHHLQWDLLRKTITLVNKNKNHPHYQLVRSLLDRRLASDQFWWASAKPWWSLQIIKKKTIELHKIALLLGSKNNKIERLVNKIISLAQKWQTTNKFKKVADRYLASGKTVRYIGGKKITKAN